MTLIYNSVATLTKYELRHLAAHLEAAGRDEDLHRLLALETVQGRNAWYEAKEAIGDTQGYLIDVTLAWQLAETQVLEGWQGVGLVIRYVLIMASLNSLVGKIPPVLLAALVEKGIWTPAQGLAYAHQMSDPNQQIEALARLITHLSETERTQVLPLVLTLTEHLLAKREPETDIRMTMKLLANVAPYLPETECFQIFQEAWMTAQAIDHNFFVQAFTLGGLAFHMPEPLIRPTLITTREIAKKWSKVFILIALALRLPESERIQVLQEALQIVGTMEDEIEKGHVLKEAAAYLPEPLLREALAMAQKIRFDQSRLDATQELVRRLAELGYPEEATIIAQNNLTPCMIVKLMPYLPEEEWREILVKYRLELIKVISDPVSLSLEEPVGVSSEIGLREVPDEKMVEKLVSPMTEPRLWEFMVMVQEIADDESRAYWLTGLAPRLAELGYTEEALTIVREVTNKESQAKALAQLTHHLSKDEAVLALQEALAATKGIKSEFGRANMLAELAPHLPKSLLSEAVAIAQDITDNEQRAETLANLVTHLPKMESVQVLQEALVAAREIADDESQAKALAKFIFHLPEGEHIQPFQDALAVAHKLKEKRGRTEALAKPVLHLSEVERAQILQEALAATQSLTDEELILTEVATHLAEMGFSNEAMKVLQKIGGQGKSVTWGFSDEESGEKVLAEMVSELSESELTSRQAKLIDNNTVERQKSIRHFAQFLAKPLSRQAEVSNIKEALAAAREIEDKIQRVYALTDLAPHLPKDKQSQVLQEAVVTAQRLEDEEIQAILLAEVVAPQLVNLNYYDEALGVARVIPDDWRRERTLEAVHILADKEAHRQTLAKIVSQLPEAFMGEILTTREITDEMTKTEALIELAHRCVKLSYHKEALAAVREIVDRRKRVEIVRDLASHLPRPFLYQALATVWEILDKKPQMKLIAQPTNLLYANLVGFTRADLLASLSQLATVTIALGGGYEANREIIRAIQDIGRWWP